jgi:hypothetical protein
LIGRRPLPDTPTPTANAVSNRWKRLVGKWEKEGITFEADVAEAEARDENATPAKKRKKGGKAAAAVTGEVGGEDENATPVKEKGGRLHRTLLRR